MNIKSLIKKITAFLCGAPVMKTVIASDYTSWQIVSGSLVSSETLRQSIDMANPAFGSDYSVDFSDVKRWLEKDPSTILLILDQNEQVAGFCSSFQISAMVYAEICDGNLCDWDIIEEASRPDHVQKAFVDKHLYFYIGAIVVRENLRGSLVFKLLLENAIDLLTSKAANGQLVHAVCEAHSPAVKHTAIKMGLQPQEISPDGYPVYAGILVCKKEGP